MLFCKDCRHYVAPDRVNVDPARCGRTLDPRFREFDPVSGEPVAARFRFYTCRSEREGYHRVVAGVCGPAGRFFEPTNGT